MVIRKLYVELLDGAEVLYAEPIDAHGDLLPHTPRGGDGYVAHDQMNPVSSKLTSCTLQCYTVTNDTEVQKQGAKAIL